MAVYITSGSKSVDTTPTSTKSKVQETAEKLGINIKGKTDDQLLDEIQRSAEKPKEVSEL